MVTKGIITSIDFNGNTCKVRVPFFETAGNDPIIGNAIISNTPGMYNGYKVDDVVLVAFEDGQMDNPVVIGKLYLGAEKEKADPRGSLNTESLTASKTASVPSDTKLTANTDKNLPNTMNPYANLSSIANNLNKLNTDVNYLDAFSGNQFRSIITDTTKQGEQLRSEIQQTADRIDATVLHKHQDGSQDALGWGLTTDSWKINAQDTVNGEVKDINIVTIDRTGMTLSGDLKLNGYPKNTAILYTQNDSGTVYPQLYEFKPASFPSHQVDETWYYGKYIKITEAGEEKYVLIFKENFEYYHEQGQLTPGTTTAYSREITSSWSTTVPGRADGKYIWQWTHTEIYSFDKETNSWNEKDDDKVACITGADGKDGTSVAQLILYKRSTETPKSPANDGKWTYNAADGSLTCSDKSTEWKTSIPSGTAPCYESHVAVLVTGLGTITIEDEKWSEPAKFVENGTDGKPGASTYTISIDNDFDSIPADVNGNVSSDYPWESETKHNVRVYYGKEAQDFIIVGSNEPASETGLCLKYKLTKVRLNNEPSVKDKVATAWINALFADTGNILYTLYVDGVETGITGKFSATKIKSPAPTYTISIDNDFATIPTSTVNAKIYRNSSLKFKPADKDYIREIIPVAGGDKKLPGMRLSAVTATTKLKNALLQKPVELITGTEKSYVEDITKHNVAVYCNDDVETITANNFIVKLDSDGLGADMDTTQNYLVCELGGFDSTGVRATDFPGMNPTVNDNVVTNYITALSALGDALGDASESKNVYIQYTYYVKGEPVATAKFEVTRHTGPTTYYLSSNVSTIKVNKNASPATITPNNVTCTAYSLDTSTNTISNFTAGTLKWKWDSEPNWHDWNESVSTADVIRNKYKQLYIELYLDNQLWDRETIDVIADGENAVDYNILVDNGQIKRDPNDPTKDTSSITFSFYKWNGSTRSNFNGAHFNYYIDGDGPTSRQCDDGKNTFTVNTNSTPAISSITKNIKVELLDEQGDTVVESETIDVVVNGSNGLYITNTKQWYKLVAKTNNDPKKPTTDIVKSDENGNPTHTTDEGWSDIPLDAINDMNLWTSLESIFSDDTSEKRHIEFSDPVKDAAYALAQGKTTNYYSPTEPIHNVKKGDCWFDTGYVNVGALNNKTDYLGKFVISTDGNIPVNPDEPNADRYIPAESSSTKLIKITPENINNNKINIEVGTTVAYETGNLKQWDGDKWADIAGELVTNKLTANYINAMDITAKKITVLDKNNNTLFEADGLSDDHSVTIGGFKVNETGLYSENHTSLESTENGVYLGSNGISIGQNFRVEAGKVIISDYTKSINKKYSITDFDAVPDSKPEWWENWGHENWKPTPPARENGKYIWEWAKEVKGNSTDDIITWEDKGKICITGAKGDIGDKGDNGEQGYSIVASVSRTAFTEENWNTYGSIGHLETWSDTSTIRNGCRVGDIFTVVGTATDTKNAHVLYYKSTTASGNLVGTCFSHSVAERGAKGDKGDKGDPGAPGEQGATGRSVLSVTKYYKLAGSEPNPPSVKDPESEGWFTTPPDFIKGNNYYESSRTIYSSAVDGKDYSWSEVVKNSMMTVEFINSLGVIAKKIEVTDGAVPKPNIIFKASSDDNIVNIGGFTVNSNRLYAGTPGADDGIELASIHNLIAYKSNNQGVKSSNAVSKIIVNKDITNLTVYIRSDAESSFDYTMISKPNVYSYPEIFSDNNVEAHTRGKQNGGSKLTDYTKVDYSNLKQGNFIYVVYQKDASVNAGADTGYLLIPETTDISIEAAGNTDYTFERDTSLDTKEAWASLKIGSNFSVDTTGAIKSTSGTIGKLAINENGLSYGNVFKIDPTVSSWGSSEKQKATVVAGSTLVQNTLILPGQQRDDYELSSYYWPAFDRDGFKVLYTASWDNPDKTHRLSEYDLWELAGIPIVSSYSHFLTQKESLACFGKDYSQDYGWGAPIIYANRHINIGKEWVEVDLNNYSSYTNIHKILTVVCTMYVSPTNTDSTSTIPTSKPDQSGNLFVSYDDYSNGKFWIRSNTNSKVTVSILAIGVTTVAK